MTKTRPLPGCRSLRVATMCRWGSFSNGACNGSRIANFRQIVLRKVLLISLALYSESSSTRVVGEEPLANPDFTQDRGSVRISAHSFSLGMGASALPTLTGIA